MKAHHAECPDDVIQPHTHFVEGGECKQQGTLPEVCAGFQAITPRI